MNANKVWPTTSKHSANELKNISFLCCCCWIFFNFAKLCKVCSTNNGKNLIKKNKLSSLIRYSILLHFLLLFFAVSPQVHVNIYVHINGNTVENYKNFKTFFNISQ